MSNTEKLRVLQKVAANYATPRTNRYYRQVVYGFYGLTDEDYLENTEWIMTPNLPFHPCYLMIWNAPNTQAYILNMKVGLEEQLIQQPAGISTDAWRGSDYPLDMMIDRYFDAKSPGKLKGIEYLVGDEMDGYGHGTSVDINDANPGTQISIKFIGQIRSILLIGTEPIEQSTKIEE